MTVLVVTANTTPVNAGSYDTHQTSGQNNAWIDSTDANNFALSDFYGADTIRLDKVSPGTIRSVGLLKFDVSAIPAGATITSALMWLRREATSSWGTNAVNCFRMLVAPNFGTGGVSWNYRVHNTQAWNTAGAQGSGSDRAATATATPALVGSNAYMSWDVTSDVQGFVDGTYTNHGWLIEGPTALTATANVMFNSKADADGFRPELVVNYTAGGGSSNGAARAYYAQL